MLIISANGKWHFLQACTEARRLHKTHVGAGLPANAVYQRQMCCLIHRYRRQASSHKSQHPQGSLLGGYSALHSARQLSSMRLEKPHSLSYQASTFSNLPLTLV